MPWNSLLWSECRLWILLVFYSIIWGLYPDGPRWLFSSSKKKEKDTVGQRACKTFLKEGSLKLLQDTVICIHWLLLSWPHTIARKNGELSSFWEPCAQLEILMEEWILGGNSSFCYPLFEPWYLWELPCCKNTIIFYQAARIWASSAWLL